MNTVVRREPQIRTVSGRKFALRPDLVVRFLIVVGLFGGAALGAFFTLLGDGHKTAPPTVEGTWELSTINGEAAGTASAPGVIWQRVSFRGGKLRGETLVQTNPGSGSVRLPFPDESVDRVISTGNETCLRVTWSGTYEIDAQRQVTLHIGKAVYFARLTWRAQGQQMEFNQDVILTFPGSAIYHHASASPPPSPHPEGDITL